MKKKKFKKSKREIKIYIYSLFERNYSKIVRKFITKDMSDYTCKIDSFKGMKKSDCETTLWTCDFSPVPFVPQNSQLCNKSTEYLKFKLKDDPNSASSREFSQQVPVIGVAIDRDVHKWVRAR